MELDSRPVVTVVLRSLAARAIILAIAIIARVDSIDVH